MTGNANSSQTSPYEALSGRPTPCGVMHLTEITAQYVPGYTPFNERIEQGYKTLKEVKKRGGGHGVMLFLIDGDITPLIQEHLDDAVPFNGTDHKLGEPDIADLVQEKREVDGAFFVDQYGRFTHKGLGVPYNMPEYKRHYGITEKIAVFMGFDLDVEDPVGLRNRGALYATHEFGETVAILTLGESGEINLYYCGDRIYSSAGREMHWEMADRKPDILNTVEAMAKPDPELQAMMMPTVQKEEPAEPPEKEAEEQEVPLAA